LKPGAFTVVRRRLCHAVGVSPDPGGSLFFTKTMENRRSQSIRPTSLTRRDSLVEAGSVPSLGHGAILAIDRMVDTMVEQVRASLRPSIVVSVSSPPWSEILYLRIENTGRSPAAHLRLAVDKDIIMGEGDQPDLSLLRTPAFSRPIPSFAPGAYIEFFLGSAHEALADRPGHPCEFTVSAQYSSETDAFSESTPIDLRVLAGTRIAIHSMESHFDRLVNAIEGLNRGNR
jgi:hypothetical protein